MTAVFEKATPGMPIGIGQHRHYKGGHYRVLFEARNAATGDMDVVYISLQDGSLHTRPRSEWHDSMDVDGDGTYLVPRFTYLG